MSLKRAALLGLLCASCAANPELRKARDTGARSLECAPEQAEVKLERGDDTSRIYVVECDLTVVRVTCYDALPCEIRPDKPVKGPDQTM